MAEQPTQTQTSEPITVKEFLEKVPPGRNTSVKGLATKDGNQYSGFSWWLVPTVLELHCKTESCNGIRFFEAVGQEGLEPGKRRQHFVTYLCRNCRETVKTYALWCFLDEEGVNGELSKFGEYPAFGPPTPGRVISILGAEREYYLKGRRAENQGLGIAAFAYYRRVVENQKNRILDEIIRVAEKIGAAPDVIDDLNAAKKETQFSKAVDAIKHGIPQALLVNCHNPLTLLHSALSEGLHAQTDERCLELATTIRVVLTDLAERLGNALKEEAELNAAVSRLLKVSAAKAADASSGT